MLAKEIQQVQIREDIFENSSDGSDITLMIDQSRPPSPSSELMDEAQEVYVGIGDDTIESTWDGSEITVIEKHVQSGPPSSISPEISAVIGSHGQGSRTEQSPPIARPRRTLFPKGQSTPDPSEDLKGSVSVESVLTDLQTSISSIPKDDGQDSLGQPQLLRASLYGYQLYGLKWLWWREYEKPYGGILGKI